MTHRARRPLAALTTAVLAAGAVLALGAAPASAATDNVVTQNIFWWGVNDNALQIEDAWSSYTDFQGTGLDFEQGFTGDAFDGFFFEITAQYNTLSLPVTVTPASASWVDGGLSTITSDGYVDFGDGRELFVDITLQIEGNYASWTFDVSSLPGATVTVRGDLGSDGTTIVVPTGAGSFVTHDTWGNDPIIGYAFTGAGSVAATAGDTYVTATAPAGGSSRIVVALQDYSPCARDEAIAEMSARAPSLISTFGEVIGLPDADPCVVIEAPASFATDTQTEQSLAFTVDASAEPDFAGMIDDGALQLVATGLPSGLSLELDPETRQLVLTGTAAPGAYTVELIFFADYDGALYAPYTTSFDLTIAPAAEAPAGAPQLAESGVSDATPVVAIVGIVLLLVGGIAMVIRRRAARR